MIRTSTWRGSFTERPKITPWISEEFGLVSIEMFYLMERSSRRGSKYLPGGNTP